MLTGIAASPGVAIGRAHLIAGAVDPSAVESETFLGFDKEWERYTTAVLSSKGELRALVEQTHAKMGADKAAIFEAHLLLLEDPEMTKKVRKRIDEQNESASQALSVVAAEFIQLFESMDNDYMRERAADIKDVTQRVIGHLRGVSAQSKDFAQDSIVVADDLTPSQTARLDPRKVLGFMTFTGGKTSHSAIMARTMEIPAVVGLGRAPYDIKDGDVIIVDGSEGIVSVNPDEVTLNKYKTKMSELRLAKQKMESLIGTPSMSVDGHRVVLAGNIGTLADIQSFKKNDAEAVGLYRTEFLFMDRTSMPTEQEQYEAYSAILKSVDGRPCIFRTLDIGGDKELDYLKIAKEMNPFLGYRAIRLCLDQIDLFKSQLRAMLRAGVHGDLSIMFPMISSVEEIKQAKAVLVEVKDELAHDGVAFSDSVKVGIMIEIPSAAILSDQLAKEVDFFSLGTNDLLQYTCAVDRMNEKVSYLYQPFNPGLLRMIHLTIENAKKAGIHVGMCGSMAHIPELVPLFLGMGLEEFSMSPMHILETRQLIRSIKYKDCVQLVNEFKQMGEAQEVHALLKNYLLTIS